MSSFSLYPVKTILLLQKIENDTNAFRSRLPVIKTAFLFAVAVLVSPAFLSAQHPLVGTWEMVSIKGVNADGKAFYMDTTAVRETKIISPTHYMLIARDVKGDSLVFNRSYAGTVRIDGNKYIEVPTQSSLPIFDNVKADFTWKLEGDRFVQSGSFTRPDGKQVKLEALVFRRVKPMHAYPNNPAIGTWTQLSSSYVNPDGSTFSHTNKTTTRFQIITPSHWMRISHNNNKFEHAIGGTYVMNGGKVYPTIDLASNHSQPEGKIEATEHVDDDRLHVTGVITSANGKKFTWNDIFERVK